MKVFVNDVVVLVDVPPRPCHSTLHPTRITDGRAPARAGGAVGAIVPAGFEEGYIYSCVSVGGMDGRLCSQGAPCVTIKGKKKKKKKREKKKKKKIVRRRTLGGRGTRSYTGVSVSTDMGDVAARCAAMSRCAARCACPVWCAYPIGLEIET